MQHRYSCLSTEHAGRAWEEAVSAADTLTYGWLTQWGFSGKSRCPCGEESLRTVLQSSFPVCFICSKANFPTITSRFLLPLVLGSLLGFPFFVHDFLTASGGPYTFLSGM